jgi:hypothetical protein
VVFRTGAAAPTGGDYLQLMEENLARLVEVDVLQGGSED